MKYFSGFPLAVFLTKSLNLVKKKEKKCRILNAINWLRNLEEEGKEKQGH